MPLMALFVPFCAWGRSVALDLRKPMAERGTPLRVLKAVVDGKVDAAGVLRSFNLDVGAADVGEVAVGDKLTLTLFDDVTITLTLGEQMPTPLGGDAFLAFEGIVVLGAETQRGCYLWDAVGSYIDPKTGKAKTYKYKESHPVSLTP